MGEHDHRICEEASLAALPERWRAPVDDFVRRFADRFGIRCAILYGSMATGSYHDRSDIDLILVSDGVPSDFLERLRTLSELRVAKAPIEALAYTSNEFAHMIQDMHVTALDGTTQGIPLYGREAFEEFANITRGLIERGLHRGKSAWVMARDRP